LVSKINGFFDEIGLTKKVTELTKPSNSSKEPDFASKINGFFEDIGLTKKITKYSNIVGEKASEIIVKLFINYKGYSIKTSR